jgi:hypothetical protein
MLYREIIPVCSQIHKKHKIKYTHKEYTGGHPVAAVEYTFTHKEFTGLHPEAAVKYTFTNTYYKG